MQSTNDELIEALDEVADVFESTCNEVPSIADLAGVVRDERGDGATIAANGLTREGSLVRHVSRVLTRLNDAGTRLRRAQARALRDEGLTTERIARLLGVTRQRVSMLLRDRPRPRT